MGRRARPDAFFVPRIFWRGEKEIRVEQDVVFIFGRKWFFCNSKQGAFRPKDRAVLCLYLKKICVKCRQKAVFFSDAPVGNRIIQDFLRAAESL